MRYCRVSSTTAEGCATDSRSRRLTPMPCSLAFVARTRGGSCIRSPTSTKWPAHLSRGPHTEHSVACDASSMTTASKDCVEASSSFEAPVVVQATSRCLPTKSPTSATDDHLELPQVTVASCRSGWTWARLPQRAKGRSGTSRRSRSSTLSTAVFVCAQSRTFLPRDTRVSSRATTVSVFPVPGYPAMIAKSSARAAASTAARWPSFRRWSRCATCGGTRPRALPSWKRGRRRSTTSSATFWYSLEDTRRERLPRMPRQPPPYASMSRR
mmetsp:Transcript_15146/g.45391  ORF Transcript_15146/g.45391 Transcript_15146/m.45391 type:complete len:269 (-) Transcript_15146:1718-2524(-)